MDLSPVSVSDHRLFFFFLLRVSSGPVPLRHNALPKKEASSIWFTVTISKALMTTPIACGVTLVCEKEIETDQILAVADRDRFNGFVNIAFPAAF